jgi:hypothetical protein
MVKKQAREEVVDSGPSVHVRVGIDAAVNSKKQLLVSQIDILKLMKGVNRYSQLRRRELELREELRIESRNLGEIIRGFNKNMPKVNTEEKFKIRNDIESINRREIIENDLENIREKLLKLGGW